MTRLLLLPIAAAAAIFGAWFAATGLVVAFIQWPLLAALAVGCTIAAERSTHRKQVTIP